jgi:hypothetical protein
MKGVYALSLRDVVLVSATVLPQIEMKCPNHLVNGKEKRPEALAHSRSESLWTGPNSPHCGSWDYVPRRPARIISIVSVLSH